MYNIFISYSHRDKAFAKKLYKELRNYSPLFRLNGKKKLHVFLDEAEAKGNELNKEITSALEASEKMIVVCSQEAKGSPWVETEVSLFNDLHNAENIIPVLLDGDPASSFPDIFKQIFPKEPWAPDFRDQRFQRINKNKNSWYHLLAAIYGVTRGTVERREFKKKLSRTILSAVLIICLAVVSFIFRNQQLISDSKELAAKSNGNIELSVKALKIWDTQQARDSLISALSPVLEQYDQQDFKYTGTSGSGWIFCYANSGILYNIKTKQKNLLYRSLILTAYAFFSHDGRNLFTINSKGKARIWDVSKGILKTTIQFDSTWEKVNSDIYGGIEINETTPDDLSLITGSHFRPETSDLSVGRYFTPFSVWDVQSGHFIGTIDNDVVFISYGTYEGGFQGSFFYDTLHKAIIYQPDERNIIAYNYRKGKIDSLFKSKHKFILLDINTKEGLFLIKNYSKLSFIGPDTFAIVHFTKNNVIKIDTLKSKSNAKIAHVYDFKGQFVGSANNWTNSYSDILFNSGKAYITHSSSDPIFDPQKELEVSADEHKLIEEDKKRLQTNIIRKEMLKIVDRWVNYY